jgi:hypothetical protein
LEQRKNYSIFGKLIVISLYLFCKKDLEYRSFLFFKTMSTETEEKKATNTRMNIIISSYLWHELFNERSMYGTYLSTGAVCCRSGVEGNGVKGCYLSEVEVRETGKPRPNPQPNRAFGGRRTINHNQERVKKLHMRVHPRATS